MLRRQIGSPLAMVLAAVVSLDCSDSGGGNADAGTGGSTAGTYGGSSGGNGGDGAPALPACGDWPEAQGPAFSLPPRAPTTVESVRRSASGRTLYGFGRWTDGGEAQRALLRSTDDGRSWCPLATPAPFTRVIPAPGDEAILWALGEPAGTNVGASAAPRDVLRSTDSGASWQSARGDLPAAIAPTGILMVGPGGGDVTWVSTTETPNGVAFTRDGGRTWRRLSLGEDPAPPLTTLAITIIVDPAQPNRLIVSRMIYAPDSGLLGEHLRGSEDWGATWSDLVSPIEPLAVVANGVFGSTIGVFGSTSTLYAAGADGDPTWRSDDWGKSWRRAPPLPTDTAGQPLVAAEGGATAGQAVVQSSDGDRLFETVDGGETWRDIATPAGLDESSAVVAAGPAPGQLLVSTSIGLQATADAGATWTVRRPQPAAVSSVAVSPTDAAVIWATTASAETLRSSDGGRTWQVLGGTRRFAAVAADPGDARAAFAVDPVAGMLFGTTDSGETWRPLAANGARPNRVVMAPDGVVLYAVTDAGIESSDDRGTSWPRRLDIGAALPDGLQLAVSPTDGHHAVVLATQGDGSSFVVETTDAGATALRKTVVPGLWFTCIAFAGDGVLLLGGQSGILRSNDGGANWSEANQGIDLGDTPGSAPRALPGELVEAIFSPAAAPAEVWALAGVAFRSSDAGLEWTSWPEPVAGLSVELRGLTTLVGDLRPGGRLLALAFDAGASAVANNPVAFSNQILLELRP